ncbi:hypothetical protein BH09PLA1_BH09PLA1_17140 [soil metagenome]
MTTLHDRMDGEERDRAERMKITPAAKPSDRRKHRRHDLAQQGIAVDRWDNKRRVGKSFGEIVDISAGGVRIRAQHNADVKADGQIRIRLELPDYAGISPFIDNTGANLEPKREWIGWMAVARVQQDGNEMDIAGRLIDMDEIDRGMLGLYLSTQPLAA